MRHGHVIGAAAMLLAAHALRAADPYKGAGETNVVATLTADWNDAKRPGGAVTVPVRIYFPKTLATMKAAVPLIVFSHGLGGSRDGYALWAEYWASHGYIVVLPTHAGSDTAAVAAALRAPDAATTAVGKVVNVQTALRRVQDVSFVIMHMQDANAGTTGEAALAPFKGKVDDQHVGMAGHSFGAETTLLISGALEAQLFPPTLSDPRVKAAIAMSPQPAVMADQKQAFGSIKIPMLYMTGTLDDAPAGLGDVKAADRRIPFDNSPLEGTCLVIFKGATHMTFSARAVAPTAQERTCYSLIEQCTTAFWDAHLKGDAKAAAWLEKDFAPVMGAAGKLERKKGPAADGSPK